LDAVYFEQRTLERAGFGPAAQTNGKPSTMNAIEIEANVDENNELHLKLPEPYHGKHARVIVLLDSPELTAPAQPPGNLDAFLAALPTPTKGRDRAEITAQVRQERADWD
ncbi:MAG: hypothetical protein GVY22_18050, partial [Gammaproteobacteria bacterium]|nr:hypothetical protein [Gammaproteobacteria bacterium]